MRAEALQLLRGGLNNVFAEEPSAPATGRAAKRHEAYYAAVGRAGLVTAEYLGPDAVVVDVGTNQEAYS